MDNGFRKSKAVNSEFVDIIPQVVIDELLSSSPECSPVGWRGHNIGPIWYSCDTTNCSIFSINGTNEKLDYSKAGGFLKIR